MGWFHRSSSALASLVIAGALLTAPPAGAESDVLTERWTRWGTGFVTDLAIADLDGDGAAEVVAAGRGVAAIDPASLEAGSPRWVNKWEGWPETPADAESVAELELRDLTGDGTPDAVVAAHERLALVDGATGETVWTAEDASPSTFQRGAWEAATADWTGDGVPDVAFSDLIDDRVSAVDGADGSPLWSSPRQGAAQELLTADLNLDGAPDAVSVGYVDAGFEVHAFSGLLAAETGVALPLWVQRFPGGVPDPPQPPIIGLGGDPTAAAVGQVRSGLAPEVVVADADGNLGVLDGASGTVLAQWAQEGGVTDLALVDLDGDPDLEIVAGSSRVVGGEPVGVAAYQPDGAPIWTATTPAPVWDLAAGEMGDAIVLAGGGWQDFGGREDLDGFGTAIDPAGEIVWTRRVPEPVEALEVGPTFGGAEAVVGQSDEGGVLGLGADGEVRWAFRTGGRVEDVAAADLDGDGTPEVLEAADDSAVAVHDAQGRMRWWDRVPGKGGPDATATAAGDLVPGDGLEVVAGTWEFDDEGPRGRVHAWAADGTRLWSRDVTGSVDAIAAADLEGDGAVDVVAVTSVGGSVVRYDGSGSVVWERPLETRIAATLDLHDVDGDGVTDLLITSKGLFDGEVYAIDGASGDELWRFHTNTGFNWVDGADEGVVAGDLAGRVYRLDPADGGETWRVDPGGSSWDGGWAADVDGDGSADLLSAHQEGEVRLLAGAGGAELWRAPVDEGFAFTVTTVLAASGPVVAAGSFGNGPIPASAVYAFDLETGQRLGRFPTRSFVMDLEPTDLDGSGDEELLVAAGWQVHALDVG